MKIKKVLAVIIAAAVFAGVILSVNAAEHGGIITAEPIAGINPGDLIMRENYIAVRGVVKDIKEISDEINQGSVIEIEETGVIFMISDETYWFNGDSEDLKPGADITGCLSN